MTKINIIIPVENYEEVKNYYIHALSFYFDDGLFFLPVNDSCTALKLIIIDKVAKTDFPPRKSFPIFNYKIDKNFLSYCKKIYENGALIESAFSTPGGYYARVSDPAGNQFEIECDSFEEEDVNIDSSIMPFFFRY